MTTSAPKLHLEKPAVDKTPTERIIEKENATLQSDVTDRDGNVYKLKLPDPIDEFDLSVALGREHSANIGVYVTASALIFIESINGVVFTKPNSYSEVRAAIKRLGRNGMDAINKAIQKYQADQQMSAEDIANLKK